MKTGAIHNLNVNKLWVIKVFYVFLHVILTAPIGYASSSINCNLQQQIDSVAVLPEGGTVTLSPGIYITGSIELKDNVTLHIDEGAVLLGSTNPYDYVGFKTENPNDSIETNSHSKPQLALISAKNAHGIKITGRGLIDGRGLELALSIDSLHHIGEQIDPNYNYRRMRPSKRPKLIDFDASTEIHIQDVRLKASASWGISLNNCKHAVIKGIDFENRAYWNNDGIDISDCYDIRIENCIINSADDGIVLKSFDKNNHNEKLLINNCDITSSASAVKIGTESFGGFKNIEIKNIRIKDTFRSAIAIESVDGAFIENIVVDSIIAHNTGNAFFIRLGHRNGDNPGSLKNITISNLKCYIPFGRPDINYDIRGPEINTIHNPIPASITGIPGYRIENITLRNIDVKYPGRGTKGMGYIGAYRYKDIPEQIDAYPEFHMFGELPAWGLYARHINGLTFENVRFSLREPDYRLMIVAEDDVHNVNGMVVEDNDEK